MADVRPVSAILAEIARGANTRKEVAARTNLPIDVVDAAIDELARLGALSFDSLTSTCPPNGCHGCHAPTGAGCATPLQGPVLLTLSKKPGPESAPSAGHKR